MARPDPSTMSDVHLLDECLIGFRDASRRYRACRIELERRLAELDRLRAIEEAARDIAQVTEERDDPWVCVPITARQWDALKAALAAKGEK